MEREGFSNNEQQSKEAKDWEPGSSFEKGVDLAINSAVESDGLFSDRVDSEDISEAGKTGGKSAAKNSDGEGGTKELQ